MKQLVATWLICAAAHIPFVYYLLVTKVPNIPWGTGDTVMALATSVFGPFALLVDLIMLVTK